jgi:hypothetical protein
MAEISATQSEKRLGDKLERYLWQQRSIIEEAKRQQIPYSIMKFSRAPEIGGAWENVAEGRSIVRRGLRMNAGDSKILRKKRGVPRSL